MATKTKPHTTTEVAWLPACDFCGNIADYDARTSIGGWANMCKPHFLAFGVGLGLGKGQKLILKKGATA